MSSTEISPALPPRDGEGQPAATTGFPPPRDGGGRLYSRPAGQERSLIRERAARAALAILRYPTES